jgi:hypothetical protein
MGCGGTIGEEDGQRSGGAEVADLIQVRLIFSSSGPEVGDEEFLGEFCSMIGRSKLIGRSCKRFPDARRSRFAAGL